MLRRHSASSLVLVAVPLSHAAAPPPLSLAPTKVPSPVLVHDIQAGDLDGDGDTDLLVLTIQGVVPLINHQGQFTPAPLASASYGAGTLRIADLTGNGLPDAVCIRQLNHQAYVCLNAGDAQFDPAVSYYAGLDTQDVALGDLDGDGDTDFAAMNMPYVRVTMGRNNGEGAFPLDDDWSFYAGSEAKGIDIADVDVDGDADIVIATHNWGAGLQTFLNDGKGNFATDGPDYGIPTFHELIAWELVVTDLDDDGIPDAAVGDSLSDGVVIFKGNADGAFTFLSALPTGSQPKRLRRADLNNDGHTDLMVVNTLDRSVTLLINNGDATFQTITYNLAFGTTPSSVAAIDINSDGLMDVAISTADTPDLHVLVQLDSPVVFDYPTGVPTTVPLGQTHIPFTATPSDEGPALEVLALTLHTSHAGAPWTASPIPIGEDGLFHATLSSYQCLTEVRWYITASLSNGVTATDPLLPLSNAYTTKVLDAAAGELQTFDDGADGWAVSSTDLESGAWELAIPIGTSSADSPIVAPYGDATSGEGAAFVTQNGSGQHTDFDVDGGPTSLTSPTLDLSGNDGYIAFSYWFYSNEDEAMESDALTVLVSNDDGETWAEVADITTPDVQWRTFSFRVADYLPTTDQVRVRFSVSDNPNNSVTEAGIDDFFYAAQPCALLADLDASGTIDSGDLSILLTEFGAPCGPACQGDIDGDGDVDTADLNLLLLAFAL